MRRPATLVCRAFLASSARRLWLETVATALSPTLSLLGAPSESAADAVLARFAGRSDASPGVLDVGASSTEHVAWVSCAHAASSTASAGKLWRRSQTADSMVWAMKTGCVAAALETIHPALAATWEDENGEASGVRVASHSMRSYAASGGAYACWEATSASTSTARSAAPPSFLIAASSSIHVHPRVALVEGATREAGVEVGVIVVVVGCKGKERVRARMCSKAFE